MLEGKNPLLAFLRASTRSFSSQSHTKPVSVQLLRQALNAFARLLNINFAETFSCPICGPSPTIIICDGTLLGFRRDLMDTLDSDSSLSSASHLFQAAAIPIEWCWRVGKAGNFCSNTLDIVVIGSACATQKVYRHPKLNIFSHSSERKAL